MILFYMLELIEVLKFIDKGINVLNKRRSSTLLKNWFIVLMLIYFFD